MLFDMSIWKVMDNFGEKYLGGVAGVCSQERGRSVEVLGGQVALYRSFSE